MHAPDLPHSLGFPWQELGERLSRLLDREEGLAIDPTGRWYEQRQPDGTLRAGLRPPLVIVGADTLPSAAELRERAEAGPGRYAILLFQAGAAALGLFEGAVTLEHKVFTRYVVRGKGRAQPTHLKTRGKSRFGSRLRLKNAERLLADVNGRLLRWWGMDPAPRRLYVSCPTRLYADMCLVKPPPPLLADDPHRVRIPIDVHTPRHRELMRVHRSINRGRVWWDAPVEEDRDDLER